MSWPTATLGDLFTISSSKRVLESQWRESGVPFYRAREIVALARDGQVQNKLFIERDLFDSLQKHGVPQAGDLMVSAVGTLGACYLVQPGDSFYYKDASVLRFAPKVDLHSQFFKLAFEHEDVLDQIKSNSGSTVGTLTISRASNIQIKLPPLAQQERLAAILDETNGLRSLRRKAIDRLDALVHSVLNERGGFGKGKYPIVELGQVARVVAGGRLGLTGANFVREGTPAYGAGGLNGYVEQVEFQGPAVILSSIGARCGKCFLVDGDWTSLANTQLIFPDPTLLEPRFLWHQVNGERKWLRHGTGQPYIKPSTVRSKQIELPPLEEQIAIVQLLEGVERRRRQQVTALAELNALYSSLQHRAFRGEL